MLLDIDISTFKVGRIQFDIHKPDRCLFLLFNNTIK